MAGVEILCSRGHTVEQILNEYPVTLVNDLISAANWNMRYEQVTETQCHSVAITHALDLAFSKGKGKIMDKFMKAMWKKPTGGGKPASADKNAAADQLVGLFTGLQQGAQERGSKSR